MLKNDNLKNTERQKGSQIKDEGKQSNLACLAEAPRSNACGERRDGAFEVSDKFNKFSYSDNIGLKYSPKTKVFIAFWGMVLSFLFYGCQENRLTQCQPIFQIARSVAENSQNISYINNEQPVEVTSWLEAASFLNRAADQIQALQINDSKLIEYQNKFATVYRIYAQATYDAVRARENMDLETLKSARSDAEQAGKIQQNLLQEINAYCLIPELHQQL